MFYSVLIVYSYLCYVELSRGTDLEALFYGVLTMLYSVSFVYSYPCYAELSGGTDLQAFKKTHKKHTFHSLLFVYSYLSYVERSNCVLFIVEFE